LQRLKSGEGGITYTTKSGKVIETPVQEMDMTALKRIRIWDERGDLAAFLPFASVPFLQGNITGGTAQIDSQQAARQNAGEQILGSLTGAYNTLGELGSIWHRKAQEAYGSMMERQAAYAADPSKQRTFRPLAFFEDLDYL
jgi:hypothetical protein